MARTTTAQPIAQPAPTFSLEALAGNRHEPEFKAVMSEMFNETKQEATAQDTDALTIRAFIKNGFTDIQARVNVPIADSWRANARLDELITAATISISRGLGHAVTVRSAAQLFVEIFNIFKKECCNG